MNARFELVLDRGTSLSVSLPSFSVPPLPLCVHPLRFVELEDAAGVRQHPQEGRVGRPHRYHFELVASYLIDH